MLFAIRYLLDRDYPDEARTLEDIRKELPLSQWQHNRLFEDLSYCAEHGIPPLTFWGYAREEQAMLLAYFRAKGSIQAYEQLLAEKEAKKKSKSH